MNELHAIKLGVTNSFILKCKDGYAVIDTSFPKFYDQFITDLKKLDIDLQDIKYLILTHHHDEIHHWSLKAGKSWSGMAPK